MVALSTILIDNGSILSWDGWQQPQPSVVWNPATPRTFTTINAPDSVFCDGAVELPDGRVVVVGGYGELTTGQIGTSTRTDLRSVNGDLEVGVANMHTPRWYPTITELADGEYVAISGNSTNDTNWADTPEIYDPTANTWTALSKVSTSQVHEDEYPFSYLDPNGNVFTIGPSEDVSYLDVNNETWTSVAAQSGVVNGSSVMYRPGKILYTGGAPDVNTPTPAQPPPPTMTDRRGPDMETDRAHGTGRIYHTLTTLADRTVLAIGGETSSDQHRHQRRPADRNLGPHHRNVDAGGPDRGLPQLPLDRDPDARRARARRRGRPHRPASARPGQYNGQIYSPSYLSNGPRPTITSAPSLRTYNTSITVTTPDASSIRAVNLVSLGADTHQSNMSQHFIPLSYTADSG